MKYKNKIMKSIPKGVLKTANEVLKDSQELAPVDGGALRNSGGVYQKPGSDEAQVYYTADYAPFVHEDLEASHPNGEAKFLEKALYANADDFLNNMKRAVKI